MDRVTRKRHLAKTLTWRILATSDTVLLGWFITGSTNIAFTIGGLEVITKMFLYYAHERVWYKFGYGFGGEKNKSELNQGLEEKDKILRWSNRLERMSVDDDAKDSASESVRKIS